MCKQNYYTAKEVMNMKKEEKIVGICFIVFCLFGMIAMMYRAEKLDQKKELPGQQVIPCEN